MNFIKCEKCKSAIATNVFACFECYTCLHPGCILPYLRRKKTLECCHRFFGSCLDANIVQNLDITQQKRKLSPQRTDFVSNKYIRLGLADEEISVDIDLNIDIDNRESSTQTNSETETQNFSSSATNMSNLGEMSNLQPLDPRMEQFMTDMRDFRMETKTSFDNLDKLNNKVENIDDRLEYIESTAVNLQSSQLKITNIPVNISDNNFDIVTKILSVLEMNARVAVFDVREILPKENGSAMDTDDVLAAVTSQSSSAQQMIHTSVQKKGLIVTFTSAAAAQAVIIKMRKKKVLFVNEIYQNEGNGKIYINQLYPPKVWELFQKVRIAARELGYSNPWVEGILIFIRQAKNSPKILIRNLEDLNNLRPSGTRKRV